MIEHYNTQEEMDRAFEHKEEISEIHENMVGDILQAEDMIDDLEEQLKQEKQRLECMQSELGEFESDNKRELYNVWKNL